MNARYAVETGGAGPGAVAVIRVTTDDAGAFFRACSLHPVAVGASAVRSLLGVDHALVARADERTVFLMPHGGPAILRAVCAGLGRIGLAREAPGGSSAWPEASDEVERRALEAVASAPSPRAVGLLLDQPGRWRTRGTGDGLADGRALGRLLRAPVVAAVGGANIGKSSLLNAVAGRSVALAFDRAGTTRDPVGVLIEADGLVVRWVDTPGTDRPGPVGTGDATPDLVLRCFDAGSDGPGGSEPGEGVRSLVVATRADLAPVGFPADAVTSAATGAGVADLAMLIRRTLVPDAVLADPRPWRFWADEGA